MRSSARTCVFSHSGKQAAHSTDKDMGQNPERRFAIDARTADESTVEQSPLLRIPMLASTLTSMLWGPLDETISIGHENGQISVWDIREGGREINSINDHTAVKNDMQINKDGILFVTASKDAAAKLFDLKSLMCLKTYKTEWPVHSAAISSIMDHVVLGGGQDAMEVTTTSTWLLLLL
ncbi:eukaryotic translation initiation factor 3 subunit I-like [Eurosta solidaginis]|uniref:eukaryotic translation initiation factor 3 subunit I-like n=1 Tax=Eurosta solidaginis TaxID=178769 RepID=UPI0035315A03